MLRVRQFVLGASTLALGLAASAGAHGQTLQGRDQEPAASGEASNPQGVQAGPDAAGPSNSSDIIVTARKREDRLIDVPLSVTAVTSADLAKLNATQFRDYANTVPGLQFTTSGVGQNQISIRGVTTGLSGSTTVGVYVDEVPYGASDSYAGAGGLSLDQSLFDVERIELLRGPQGTLYGASAMGGVLRYITKEPSTTDFSGDAQAGISSTRFGGVGYNGAAAVNLPVVEDKVAIRASGYYSHDGGFIDNIGLNEKDEDRSRTYGGRFDLLLKPIDRLKIRIVGAAQNIARDGMAVADYRFDGTPAYGDLQQRRIVPEPFDQQFRLVSGTIDYDFGSVGLTSISSYQTLGTQQRIDYSGLYVPLLGSFGLPFGSIGVGVDTFTRKFAQEVRLASTGGGPFEWQIGSFYTHEKNSNHQFIFATDVSGAPSTINLFNLQLPTTYEEYAGFANLTYRLTDKLQLTGGIRYAHNDQTTVQIGSGLLIGSLPKSTSRENVTTYLASAKYQFSRNGQVYFRYATGFRPGGPNAVALDPVTGNPLAPPTFASDTLKSYEGGLKAETADKTFAIDVDGYYIDWKNIQIVTARNGLAVIVNASSGAHIYGSDLTLIARPSSDFTITGAFGYIDAHLAAADADLGGRKGERLPDVPHFTGTVSADYVMHNGGYQPRFGATVRFVSDREASFDASPNFPQYDLGDYVSVDLRAGATIGPIDVQAFARNIFDERGQLSANTRLTGFGAPPQIALQQPRTIGLSLSTQF